MAQAWCALDWYLDLDGSGVAISGDLVQGGMCRGEMLRDKDIGEVISPSG